MAGRRQSVVTLFWQNGDLVSKALLVALIRENDSISVNQHDSVPSVGKGLQECSDRPIFFLKDFSNSPWDDDYCNS